MVWGMGRGGVGILEGRIACARGGYGGHAWGMLGKGVCREGSSRSIVYAYSSVYDVI